MLFVDDIAPWDENKRGVNVKLEFWTEALESEMFKIRLNKIKITSHLGMEHRKDAFI